MVIIAKPCLSSDCGSHGSMNMKNYGADFSCIILAAAEEMKQQKNNIHQSFSEVRTKTYFGAKCCRDSTNLGCSKLK